MKKLSVSTKNRNYYSSKKNNLEKIVSVMHFKTRLWWTFHLFAKILESHLINSRKPSFCLADKRITGNLGIKLSPGSFYCNFGRFIIKMLEGIKKARSGQITHPNWRLEQFLFCFVWEPIIYRQSWLLEETFLGLFIDSRVSSGVVWISQGSLQTRRQKDLWKKKNDKNNSGYTKLSTARSGKNNYFA